MYMCGGMANRRPGRGGRLASKLDKLYEGQGDKVGKEDGRCELHLQSAELSPAAKAEPDGCERDDDQEAGQADERAAHEERVWVLLRGLEVARGTAQRKERKDECEAVVCGRQRDGGRLVAQEPHERLVDGREHSDDKGKRPRLIALAAREGGRTRGGQQQHADVGEVQRRKCVCRILLVLQVRVLKR